MIGAIEPRLLLIYRYEHVIDMSHAPCNFRIKVEALNSIICNYQIASVSLP